MKSYIFNYTDDTEENYTVIFDCNLSFNKNRLMDDIKKYATNNLVSRKCIYLFPCTYFNGNDISKDIVDILNMSIENIELLVFDENGLGDSANKNNAFRKGILNIIKTRNAILECDDTFHYVLPSHKHSPFFIRTGNILSNSYEINFIALVLLDKIKDMRISEIACDTSSIIQIAYSINYLKSLFGKSLDIPFKSFGSYADLTKFPFKSETLVLISASSSGGLENVIRGDDVKEKNLEIISVIYNSVDETNKKFLINIHDEFDELLTNKIKRQFKPNEVCGYCSNNSIPVTVRTEQFIPSRTLIQKVLIDTKHIPDWHGNSISSLICKKIVFAYRRERATSKRRDIFLDITKMSFTSIIDEYIARLNYKIDYVVVLNDKASFEIGESIKILLDTKGKSTTVITPDKIDDISDCTKEYDILVASSCITTGKNFNEISKDLRRFSKSSIYYFSIVSRLNDSNKLLLLKKNVLYKDNKDSPYKKTFHSIIDCFLGDYNDTSIMNFEKPSWHKEIDILESEDFEHSFITDRIEELNNENGLLDNLFYRSPFDNSRLKLRENFALYKFNSGDNPTQADVYLIVSGIFHYLRNPKYIKAVKHCDNPIYLLQHEHVRTIIDPECFSRYNDGILQSCILRIARYHELNYNVSEEESSNMLKILIRIFSEKGEATLEFLYSILIGKLKLKRPHLDELITFLSNEFKENDVIMLFVNKIIRDIDKIYKFN